MDYLQIADCLVRSSTINSAPDEWPQAKPCLNALLIVAKEYHDELWNAVRMSMDLQKTMRHDLGMMRSEQERERMLRDRIKRIETILKIESTDISEVEK